MQKIDGANVPITAALERAEHSSILEDGRGFSLRLECLSAFFYSTVDYGNQVIGAFDSHSVICFQDSPQSSEWH
jgi:hypothetical protein